MRGLRHIRNALATTVVAASLMIASTPAISGVISLSPSSGVVNLGDSFTVDLLWDGSADVDGDPFSGFLGAFDVNIGIDDSLVAFTSGDCLVIPSFFCYVGLLEDPPFSGVFIDSEVDAAEIFVTPPTVGPAAIATMTFATGGGLGAGIADFIIDELDPFLYIGDYFGSPYADALVFESASVCIEDGSGICEVPSPATLPLMLLGLLGFALHQRRQT